MGSLVVALVGAELEKPRAFRGGRRRHFDLGTFGNAVSNEISWRT